MPARNPPLYLLKDCHKKTQYPKIVGFSFNNKKSYRQLNGTNCGCYVFLWQSFCRNSGVYHAGFL